MSNNYLRIVLLGATLDTKIFHEYGPELLFIGFTPSDGWLM